MLGYGRIRLDVPDQNDVPLGMVEGSNVLGGTGKSGQGDVLIAPSDSVVCRTSVHAEIFRLYFDYLQNVRVIVVFEVFALVRDDVYSIFLPNDVGLGNRMDVADELRVQVCVRVDGQLFQFYNRLIYNVKVCNGRSRDEKFGLTNNTDVDVLMGWWFDVIVGQTLIVSGVMVTDIFDGKGFAFSVQPLALSRPLNRRFGVSSRSAGQDQGFS